MTITRPHTGHSAWTRSLFVAVSIGIFSPFACAEQNVVVVFDDSSSMLTPMTRSPDTTRLDAAKTALLSVLRELPDTANVGVRALNFASASDHWIATLGPIDRTQADESIQAIIASGSTPLGNAMVDAGNALLAERAKRIVGSYQLLIVTDGEASDQEIVQRVLPLLRSRGLVVDVIGVDMADDHSLATQVTSYRRADDPDSLRQAIADVFAETADDRDDAGQSDYQWLSGIPDEVARDAIKSLTDVNNEALFTQTNTQSPGQNSPGQGPPSQGLGLLSSALAAVGGFCCIGVVVLVVLTNLALSGRKRSR